MSRVVKQPCENDYSPHIQVTLPVECAACRHHVRSTEPLPPSRHPPLAEGALPQHTLTR